MLDEGGVFDRRKACEAFGVRYGREGSSVRSLTESESTDEVRTRLGLKMTRLTVTW